MRYWIINPCAELARFIKNYWVLEVDDTEGDITERVIPTGTIELMFHYKKPFYCNYHNQIIFQPRSSISGISHSYSDVTALSGSGVIAVTFYPYGACQFFKFPLSEIDNSMLSLSDIDNQEIRRVEEQIMNLPNLRDKIQVIEKYLINKLQLINNHDFIFLNQGIRVIRSRKGLISVVDLSKDLFTTKRTMERKFNTYLGKSPKQYIRLVRFHEVLKGLYNLNNMNLTEFTYENGYYDQSHFINDLKQLTGYTPTELLEKCPEPITF